MLVLGLCRSLNGWHLLFQTSRTHIFTRTSRNCNFVLWKEKIFTTRRAVSNWFVLNFNRLEVNLLHEQTSSGWAQRWFSDEANPRAMFPKFTTPTNRASLVLVVNFMRNTTSLNVFFKIYVLLEWRFNLRQNVIYLDLEILMKIKDERVLVVNQWWGILVPWVYFLLNLAIAL